MKSLRRYKTDLFNVYFRNYFFTNLLVIFCFLFFSDFSYSSGRPDSFADLAARLKPAVVNVSTTHDLSSAHSFGEMPKAPPGSPFEEFFKEFFDCSIASIT